MLVLVLTISRCPTILELPPLLQIICGEKTLGTPEDKELLCNNNREHRINTQAAVIRTYLRMESLLGS